MLEYTKGYLKPNGLAPLIGDNDGGQVMPVVQRTAADQAYLLGVAAVVLDEPKFKIDSNPPEELFWILGPESLKRFADLDSAVNIGTSSCFRQAGIAVLRHDDLYLLFNASGTGLNGRGSHAHNDALSLEVTACGANFAVDPGTFVYTGDRRERHLFRSTHYHSTVQVDGKEQNTIDERTPFRIGDEAKARILHWETSESCDIVVAEHYGYRKLANGPITHRRAVRFDKRNRYWLLEDTLSGTGTHEFKFIFHFAPDLEIQRDRNLRKTDSPHLEIAEHPHNMIEACDRQTGARLLIVPLDVKERAELQPRWFSQDYGAKVESVAAYWTVRTPAPLTAHWLLLPIRQNDNEGDRLVLIDQLRTAVDSQSAIRNSQSEIRNRQSKI